MRVDLLILLGAFAAGTLVAELAGARNTGAALAFGQLAFGLALVVVLVRRPQAGRRRPVASAGAPRAPRTAAARAPADGTAAASRPAPPAPASDAAPAPAADRPPRPGRSKPPPPPPKRRGSKRRGR